MQQYVQKNIKQEVRQIIALQNGVHKCARQNQQFNSNMYSILSDNQCLNINRIKRNFIGKINIIQSQLNQQSGFQKQKSLTTKENIKGKLSIDRCQTHIKLVQKQASRPVADEKCQTISHEPVDFKNKVQSEQASRITIFSNIQSQEIILQIPSIIKLRQNRKFQEIQTQTQQEITPDLLAAQRTPKRNYDSFDKQNQYTKNKQINSSQKRRSYALNPSPHITPHASIKKNKEIHQSNKKTSKIFSSNEKRRKFIEMVSLYPNRKNVFSSCPFATQPY